MMLIQNTKCTSYLLIKYKDLYFTITQPSTKIKTHALSNFSYKHLKIYYEDVEEK